MKLSVIMPVWNEAATLQEILRLVLATACIHPMKSWKLMC
jgi:glycosyltransferase involved in cell wall biosynthesis